MTDKEKMVYVLETPYGTFRSGSKVGIRNQLVNALGYNPREDSLEKEGLSDMERVYITAFMENFPKHVWQSEAHREEAHRAAVELPF